MKQFLRSFLVAASVALMTASTSHAGAYVPTPAASDGSYSSYIRVTWSASSSARYGYYVYRSTTPYFSQAYKLGRTTNRYWYDYQGSTARKYYYWVCPIYKKSGSWYYYWYNTSHYNAGFKRFTIPTPTVSKGKSTASLYLSWSSSPHAKYGYTIYRGTSASFAYASKIGTTYNRYYYDSTAYPGRTYYYWVAVNGYNVTVYESSKRGSGYRSLAVPYAKGYNTSYGVYLYWDSVYGASSYRIYRGTSSSISSASWVGTTYNTYWTDTSVVSGRKYYYWICPIDCEGDRWYNTGKWGSITWY